MMTARKFELIAPDVSQPNHVRKRPIWMHDYEVPSVDESDDILTHYALFSDCDPVAFEEAVKEEKWQKQWMKRLSLSRKTIHKS